MKQWVFIIIFLSISSSANATGDLLKEKNASELKNEKQFEQSINDDDKESPRAKSDSAKKKISKKSKYKYTPKKSIMGFKSKSL